MSRTALLPVVLLFVCFVPLAFAASWTPVVLLVPLLAAFWVLRVGVDVADDGVTVRSLLGSRRVAWADVAGIRVGRRADLWLVTTGGTEVRLPVLRPRDLPRLAALSGGRFAVPEPPR
ncbi:PH domain-containing protein [Geodermatophilus ruber]|nr:PH domain-containing protein [Geodermatophilus ruber]